MCLFFIPPRSKEEQKILNLLNMIFLILFLCFSLHGLLPFYMAFEASLIPIFLIIMGWGYQPERLAASISLVIYTVFASLPLLILLLLLTLHSPIPSFFSSIGASFALTFSSLLYDATSLILIMGFLVKFPLYLIHL
jgi:NADH-ubiquinone oxidoreductase chain 4